MRRLGIFGAILLGTLLANVSVRSLTPYLHRADPRASIVYISSIEEESLFDGGQGSCTGMVIAKNRVLTAAHCKGVQMWADGEKGKIQKVDDYFDLLLLDVKTHRPAIVFEDEPVSLKDPVSAVGYAAGWPVLTTLDGHVVGLASSPTTENAPGLIIQCPLIPGQSGGPLLNWQGHVIGIVQQGMPGVGYGVPTLIVRAFLYGTR